jgi:hypothetical protein
MWNQATFQGGVAKTNLLSHVTEGIDPALKWHVIMFWVFSPKMGMAFHQAIYTDPSFKIKEMC